jgi:preprotein translocase subunit SecF
VHHDIFTILVMSMYNIEIAGARMLHFTFDRIFCISFLGAAVPGGLMTFASVGHILSCISYSVAEVGAAVLVSDSLRDDIRLRGAQPSFSFCS